MKSITMRYSSQQPLPRDSADHPRAECFARLVLTGREDHHGRNLLDYAEGTADRLAMQREKTIAWLSISLHADSVDETTLTGIGFNDQDVRHATVMQPRENETAMAYAERLAAYNEPEAFAVGEAMLDESPDTNPTVPTRTTDTAREQAIGRLRSAHKDWAQGHRGDRPPAGGVVDERPTAPGLADAVRRLEHHVRMTGLCLSEMQRGPGGTPWGIAERLSLDDLNTFLDAASQLMFNAAAIVIETSNLTLTPATEKERATLAGTRDAGTEHLAGIATAAATIYMAAPNVPCEEQDELTEWVDAMAFSEAMQARLLACEKVETIAVSGNVTKRLFQRRNGETAVGRTIIADYVRAAGASIAGYTPRKPAERVEEAPQPDQPPE